MRWSFAFDRLIRRVHTLRGVFVGVVRSAIFDHANSRNINLFVRVYLVQHTNKKPVTKPLCTNLTPSPFRPENIFKIFCYDCASGKTICLAQQTKVL